MSATTVVIHERIGRWARQLRPRLADWPIRWVETRSSDDLKRALSGLVGPIVVVDLANRLSAGLEDLDAAVRSAPDALVLVLDPEAHDGAPLLARELGATHVFSGVVTPPEVVALLTRWLTLSADRAARQGWTRGSEPVSLPEPWSWLSPLLSQPPAFPGARRP